MEAIVLDGRQTIILAILVVALGILLLLSGVHGFLMGLDRMRAAAEWAERWPPAGVRAWAVFQTALGVILLSAAW